MKRPKVAAYRNQSLRIPQVHAVQKVSGANFMKPFLPKFTDKILIGSTEPQQNIIFYCFLEQLKP
jgi:hypothetical protein